MSAHLPARTFTDFTIGDRMRLGPVTVERTEAIAFARRYDPQPFLLCDEDAERNPLFRRLPVSGWLVSALVNRLLVEELRANPVAVMGQPGVDRLRWVRPVFPGDQLSVEAEVVRTHLLLSRRDVGVVRQRLRVRNQDRRVVLTAELSLLVAAPARRFVLERWDEA
ncbi:MAG: MaoC/PaaZ C-terminal domain-containing protein [Sphingomonadaceae bacterium]|uniref:MaoC/PaaZ C-terminal domain-containing protein n=1 Tax=Thermaurantiacus sp. TaxID=2820283 RepID=UPI00298F29D7|nr:MaoC/PaaZ C-terminal domain-containing protein [Thermaurantiacus sp.]MCS6986805.1 MaoC/PaaZ C-terminal domain-containing protein [Sphingomonadaceae bacterium]MDW8413932.1 MaoC/PaaZ C-terminal domain-containing protein [Thermaurantiacus sp.]